MSNVEVNSGEIIYHYKYWPVTPFWYTTIDTFVQIYKLNNDNSSLSFVSFGDVNQIILLYIHIVHHFSAIIPIYGFNGEPQYVLFEY